jgi:hypothetical protein
MLRLHLRAREQGFVLPLSDVDWLFWTGSIVNL